MAQYSSQTEMMPRPVIERSVSIAGVTKHSRKQYKRRQQRTNQRHAPYSFRSRPRHESLTSNSCESGEEDNTRENVQRYLSDHEGGLKTVRKTELQRVEGKFPRLTIPDATTINAIGKTIQEKLSVHGKDEESCDTYNDFTELGENINTRDELQMEAAAESISPNQISLNKCPFPSRQELAGNNTTDYLKIRYIQEGAIPKRMQMQAQNISSRVPFQPLVPTQIAPIQMRTPFPSSERRIGDQNISDIYKNRFLKPSGDVRNCYTERYTDGDDTLSSEDWESPIHSLSFEDTIFFNDQDIDPRQPVSSQSDDIAESRLRRKDTWILPSPETPEEDFDPFLGPLCASDLVVLGKVPKEFLCIEDSQNEISEETPDENSDSMDESDDDGAGGALKTSKDRSAHKNLLNSVTKFKCVMCDANLEMQPDYLDRLSYQMGFTDFTAPNLNAFGETDLFCPQCDCRRCGYYSNM